MNIFVASDNEGRKLIALRLEPANLYRIQKGEPVRVHLDDYFPEGIPPKLDLLIDYSATPVADARELAKHAEVSIDERTARTQQTRPQCPQCKSTIEQLGAWTSDTPVALIFCPVCGATMGAMPAALLRKPSEYIELKEALRESVELQNHYAELLNMHDGGERRGFASAEEWMQRVKELRKPEPTP